MKSELDQESNIGVKRKIMTDRILAKDVDPKRPKYLVIFKEVSERNTEVLTEVLNLQQSSVPNIHTRAGVKTLSSHSQTCSIINVYERLGISTMDLSDDEVVSLRKREEVEDIVENEVRFLPPTNKSTESDEPSNEAKPPILAYLQGMRDAANLAIAFYEGREANILRSSINAEGINPAAIRSTWGLKAIGIAPNFSGPTGRGVKVAVLDTGIDLNHPDLRNKVVQGVSAVSLVDGFTVQDVNGHGTHCAGIICGPRTSISGTRYGVAPDVDLLVGKVFNNDAEPGATDDDILEGITWAEEKGARIISMSLGSFRRVGGAFPRAYERIANRLLNRPTNSVLIVAAAGNGSQRPFFTRAVENPGACPSIMAVASVDSSLRLASSSCRQMDNIGEVNVSGPGVGVFSSYTGGGFEFLSGTSMATPHVAGMAALYLEQNPNLTARQVFQVLRSRAQRLGDPADFGSGLIRLV